MGRQYLAFYAFLVFSLAVIKGNLYPLNNDRNTSLTDTSVVGTGDPVLHKKIIIPSEFLQSDDSLNYGGDIRIGDLNGDGQANFLVYRSQDDAHDGGGMKPCFWGAFTQEGEILWQRGKGGEQPSRPGPVAIFDIDQDGMSEIITFSHLPEKDAPAGSMADVEILILDGATGTIEQRNQPAIFSSIQGKGANWVHQRILIANLRGRSSPQDFVIKLGTYVLAFDNELNILWSYQHHWQEYSRVPAYVPAVGDVDNDGKDEVNGGYYLLDDDGTVLWEEMLSRHMDAVVVDYWDHSTKKRAFGSGFGHILDEQGNIILKLGEDVVPHGQELRVARFDATVPGPQMMIRYNGHHPDVMLVNQEGEVVRQFQLNESPNNTGMEAVYWNGIDQPAMLYNGGELWNGQGESVVTFMELPPPRGNPRQGWYHCIPANVCGDEREEVVLYNPWDTAIYIYSPSPLDEDAFTGYQPQPRQYNVRLMD